MEFVNANCANAPGFVYIIGEQGNSNYYKVGGSTIGAQSRIDSIHIGNPHTLVQREQFPVNSCSQAEIAAHAILTLNFVANRYLQGGQWHYLQHPRWRVLGHEWYYVPPNHYNTFRLSI